MESCILCKISLTLSKETTAIAAATATNIPFRKVYKNSSELPLSKPGFCFCGCGCMVVLYIN